LEPVFAGIAAIIILSALFGYLMHRVRQPLLPAYILAGVLVGPLILAFGRIFGISYLVHLTDLSFLTDLSHIGVAFLLFVVGLEMEIRKINRVSLPSFLVALVPTVVIALVVIPLAMLTGLSATAGAYLSLILSFSSTMVVLKLLSDRGELPTLHGRIITGTLLFQDFIAIIALAMLPGLQQFSALLMLRSLLKGLALVLSIVAISDLVFAPMMRVAARSSELLFLMSLSVCFIAASAAELAGFSIEIGAFIAGLSLASLPYKPEIVGRMLPVRNFFIILFYAALGMGLYQVPDWNLVWSFLAVVLILKPLAMMLTLDRLGFSRSTSFLTGVNLAQTSEFSLILVPIAIQANILPATYMVAITLVTLLTFVSSSYVIRYANRIYLLLRDRLFFLHRANLDKFDEFHTKKPFSAVLCGYNRTGYGILKSFKEKKKEILVVDYNPETIHRLRHESVPCIYGDLSDPEIVDRIFKFKPKVIISTVPDLDVNQLLIEQAEKSEHKVMLFVTASWIEDALRLYERGAHYVMLPNLVAGDYLAGIVHKHGKSHKHVHHLRKEHIKELKRRHRHAAE